MENPEEFCSKDVCVVNELGIHARSAAKIAEIARFARHDVSILRDGDKVDAKSIIDILTLGCAKGTTVTVTITSRADAHILEDIVTLIENGFGE